MGQFELGSSPVDWCEENYGITVFVAEFFNTISNALFFVIPPLMIYLFRQYTAQVTSHINIVWVLMFVVGMGSVYFHATLSLFGQLIDEISILWVIIAGVALWFPKQYMPAMFHKNRKSFKLTMLFFAMICSLLCCAVPAINHIALFGFGAPATWLLVYHLSSCKTSHVFHLGVRCCLTWITALICWISDRAFCDVWSWLKFPYMHCLWHILIAIASYTACVLFAYFDALTEVPEQSPVLKYWPLDSWQNFGVPYVQLTDISWKTKKVSQC